MHSALAKSQRRPSTEGNWLSAYAADLTSLLGSRLWYVWDNVNRVRRVHTSLWFFQVWVNICAVMRVVMYVCELHLLVGLGTAGCILSIHDWVVPHSFCVIDTFWLVVILQVVFFYGFSLIFLFWLCLYLFTDSTWCHILLGGRPWLCMCDRFQLGKTYLGAVTTAGPGSFLRLGLRYMHID